MQFPSQPITAPQLPVSPEVLLSLAMGPVLLGVLTGTALLNTLTELGRTSEEVFRGDRLPLLKFPPQL